MKKLIIISLVLLVGCKAEPKFVDDSGTKLTVTPEKRLDLEFRDYEEKEFSSILIRERKGVNFIFKLLSAPRFLAHASKSLSASEYKEVENESVMIFELENRSQGKSVFENKNITLSKDDAVTFLIGNLTQELWIEQEGKKLYASGSQYEGTIGALSNKLRVLLFFNGIDLTKNYTVKYDDPIFDAGLIVVNTTQENKLL